MKTLEESLNALTAVDYLTDENKYECEICQEKTDASKSVVLEKVPPILTLCLSRFEYD